MYSNWKSDVNIILFIEHTSLPLYCKIKLYIVLFFGDEDISEFITTAFAFSVVIFFK
jgi:hypothetical protein